MVYLIAGSTQVDAGKTTFATGLAYWLSAPAYKPRAGNNYWYDHDTVLESIQSGTLLGGDIVSLTNASPENISPTQRNPIHRLWIPTPGPGKGILGQTRQDMLIDRVTISDQDHYIVNGTIELPGILRESLPLESAIEVNYLEELNQIMAEYHRTALNDVLGDIRHQSNPVVESYADIARPLANLVPEVVAVIEPRRCQLYRGDRFANACDVAGSSPFEGQIETRIERVLNLIDPIFEHSLPVLTGTDRSNPKQIAAEYDVIYESLLSVTE